MESTIRYGSVCSGIEAATVAWHPLGWKADWLAEIEPFPSAVLAHHYPNTPNLGDMTKLAPMVLTGRIAAPDVLVGGTPCQAFSVAGLREGLSDPRGALTIKYVELADAIDFVRTRRGDDECVIVWENVPGVLSDKGNAFGCFLGALAGEDCELRPSGEKWTDAGCVYGPKRTIAWRVLDAQYFGLAQRRRRVFLVASARKGFDPAAVLFEREGVRRDSAPSRTEGAESASAASGSARSRSHWDGPENPHPTLTQSHNTGGIDSSNQEVFSQRGAGIVPHGFRMVAFGEYADDGTASTMKARDYKDATDLAVMAVHGTQDPDVSFERAHTLGRNGGQENAIAYPIYTQIATRHKRMGEGTGLGIGSSTDPAFTLQAAHSHAVAYGIPGNWIGRSPEHGGNATEPGHNLAPCLAKTDQHGVCADMAVRRLTPTECERLQGFPDSYTLIPTWDGWRKMDASETPESCIEAGLEVRQTKTSKRWYVKDADGPRYKALGNSKAVPVVRWVGARINTQLGGAHEHP